MYIKAFVGILLIITGIVLIVYQFKIYSEIDNQNKTWEKIISFILDIVSGQGGAALGLALTAVGLILLLLGLFVEFASNYFDIGMVIAKQIDARDTYPNNGLVGYK